MTSQISSKEGNNEEAMVTKEMNGFIYSLMLSNRQHFLIGLPS